ncbi:MAG: hypothetical protein U0Z53_04220 [Blastocatellia bacterium]
MANRIGTIRKRSLLLLFLLPAALFIQRAGAQPGQLWKFDTGG